MQFYFQSLLWSYLPRVLIFLIIYYHDCIYLIYKHKTTSPLSGIFQMKAMKPNKPVFPVLFVCISQIPEFQIWENLLAQWYPAAILPQVHRGGHWDSLRAEIFHRGAKKPQILAQSVRSGCPAAVGQKDCINKDCKTRDPYTLEHRHTCTHTWIRRQMYVHTHIYHTLLRASSRTECVTCMPCDLIEFSSSAVKQLSFALQSACTCPLWTSLNHAHQPALF